jgi:hypothetical protein
MCFVLAILFQPEVQTGRYDAQGSVLLTGDGKSNFKAVPSPMQLKGDNKSIVEVSRADGESLIVVGINSDSIRVFTVNMFAKKIKLAPFDQYALIKEKNGKIYRQEFYYGNTYLSQSERVLSVVPEVAIIRNL